MTSATTSPRGGRPASVRDGLRELLKLAGPVVATRLGVMTMGLTDAVIVGRHSARELGYQAMGWAPTSVVLTTAMGLLIGTQVMTARAIGEGRRDRTGAVLRRGVVDALWIGIVTMLVLLLAGPPFLRLLRLDPQLTAGAGRVMRVLALSMPLQALNLTASMWLEGQGRPRPATAVCWTANALNLAVGLLLVPGSFGMPALGAVGAAWATFVARGFMALALLGFIARMPEARAWGVFAKAPKDRSAARLQRRVGYGAAASNFFETAAFAGMSVIAGWVDDLTVAAWAIVLNVVTLLFMVPLGLSTAGGVTVGRAYGAADARGVRRAGLTVFGVALAFGLTSALLITPAAPLIVRAYVSDHATMALAAPALVLAGFFMIPDALQVVAAQALRARGDVLVPSCTHLASYVLIMLPLAWQLAIPERMGLSGILWAIIVASFASSSLLLGRFWMLDRRSNA